MSSGCNSRPLYPPFRHCPKARRELHNHTNLFRSSSHSQLQPRPLGDAPVGGGRGRRAVFAHASSGHCAILRPIDPSVTDAGTAAGTATGPGTAETPTPTLAEILADKLEGLMESLSHPSAASSSSFRIQHGLLPRLHLGSILGRSPQRSIQPPTLGLPLASPPSPSGASGRSIGAQVPRASTSVARTERLSMSKAGGP
jgi:hypothetical protein